MLLLMQNIGILLEYIGLYLNIALKASPGIQKHPHQGKFAQN